MVATPRTPINYNLSIFGRRFQPNSVRVPVGSTVTWTNNDRLTHRIVGSTFKSNVGGRYDISPFRQPDVPAPPVTVLDSGILAKRGDPPTAGADRPVGGKYTYTFSSEGTYTFQDASIPSLAGRIVVIPLVDPPISRGSGSGSGAPTATAVPVGGPPEKIISIFGSRFKPPVIRIPVGTTVKWRNGDRIPQSFFGVRFKNSTGVTHDWSPSPSSLIPVAPFAPLDITLDARPTPVAGSPYRDESTPSTYSFAQAGSYSYRGDNATLAGTIIFFTPR